MLLLVFALCIVLYVSILTGQREGAGSTTLPHCYWWGDGACWSCVCLYSVCLYSVRLSVCLSVIGGQSNYPPKLDPISPQSAWGNMMQGYIKQPPLWLQGYNGTTLGTT